MYNDCTSECVSQGGCGSCTTLPTCEACEQEIEYGAGVRAEGVRVHERCRLFWAGVEMLGAFQAEVTP